MNLRRIRLEAVLYAIALLAALAVRITHLGYVPLNNGEAELALQAQAAAAGENPLIDPHPAYIALTTAVFFLFGGSDTAARFIPALAGGLLVLLPALFRRVVGKTPALLLAFLLAFDPLLLAVSRQGGSLSLAVFLMLLAFGLWINRRVLAAAVATGLALLGGPGLWPGAIGLLLALWASGGLTILFRLNAASEERWTLVRGSAPWKTALFAGLAAFFFVGTLFFALPNGINAAAESLAAYLFGWIHPVGTPLGLALINLLFYEFFPIIFAGWGAVSGLLRRDPVDRFLLLWGAIALILAAAYPARDLLDMVWVVVPMWTLASRQITQTILLPDGDRAPVIGQIVLSAVILSYISLTTVGMINNPASANTEVTVRLGGALLLLAASTGLVAWGWTRLVALRGLVLGAAVILFVYTLSAAWDAAGHSSRSGWEIWSGGASPLGASLLTQTIDDLNQWSPKQAGGLDLVVIEKSTPALRWLLRDYRNLTFVDQLESSASPALVITPETPELALAATYRGQSFGIADTVLWNALQPVEWLRWFVFRTLPANAVLPDRLILWVRLDVLPVGETEAALPEGAPQITDSDSDVGPE